MNEFLLKVKSTVCLSWMKHAQACSFYNVNCNLNCQFVRCRKKNTVVVCEFGRFMLLLLLLIHYALNSCWWHEWYASHISCYVVSECCSTWRQLLLTYTYIDDTKMTAADTLILWQLPYDSAGLISEWWQLLNPSATAAAYGKLLSQLRFRISCC